MVSRYSSWSPRGTMRLMAMTALVGSVTLSGCDLEVVNPGPIADEFLDDQGSWPAILTGSRANLTRAMNIHITDGALRARELHISDVNDWNGFSFPAHIGQPVEDAPSYLSSWNAGHAARWIAEDLLRRAGGVLDDAAFASHPVIAQGQLWAGYANRVLGEYYCDAVFDGGPLLPNSAYFERAEGHFTAAIATAAASNQPTIETAARAGRASVRVHLDDWAGAVQDAGAVQGPFQFDMTFATDADWRFYNALSQSTGQTVWNTQFGDYYTQTGDPRTPWTDNGMANSTVHPWEAGITWWVQQKHVALSSAVRLSSWQEMRLIEAENLLRQSDMTGAMNLISSVRQAAGVADWPTPATLDEAWSLLKRERGIELWLEGRRLADLRRWDETLTPGALQPEDLGGVANGGPDLSNRVLCLPVTGTERERNENIPDS